MLALIPGAPIFGGAKPVPFNPDRLKYDEWGAALVALAGPFTNLFIAFVLYASYALFGIDADTLAGQFLLIGVVVNLGFFLFNMLPIPPLDGSRVLYAVAPEFARRGMETIERYGLIVIFVIVLVASPVIGAFIQGASGSILNVFFMIFGR